MILKRGQTAGGSSGTSLSALSFPKIPSGGDSRGEAESGHHLAQCSGCSTCLGRSSPTCSSRNAGLKSRTSFSDISSILLRGVHRTVHGFVGLTGRYWYG